MSYDYTVLAGTQGLLGHEKKDRLFELAERRRLPVVFFTEGGGGRPGDTDGLAVSGLDTLAFYLFARLSGLVPLIGIASGYCFAGNAAILGCCDVVIGVAGTNIAMGGPAMIEGGGLGTYEPTEIGPFDVQVANGVIDIAVDDDADAVTVAKQYLSYFTGIAVDWSCGDQDRLRHLVPENRSRVYDVRAVIDAMFDTRSVLELRRGWAPGIVTSLARVEGRPLGVVANDPAHLGGAIDVDGADKGARFLQLCDAFDLPVLFLCDTPGFMVGPEHEARAAVRHVTRLFVTGANLTVPFGTIVLRKGYGLGAQAMAGGSFKAPEFCVSWPTGEFGGMNLEGAVRLSHARELAAISDPEERERAVPRDGGASVRGRRGDERRHALRDRRRHRPGRVAHLDPVPADRTRCSLARREEAAEPRHLVSTSTPISGRGSDGRHPPAPVRRARDRARRGARGCGRRGARAATAPMPRCGRTAVRVPVARRRRR